MIASRWETLILMLTLLAGCSAPSARLTFPAAPISQNSKGWFYDVHHRGKPDFALLKNDAGRVESVAYDDDGNGNWDRVYRLGDYADVNVPHLIVLLDSIPFDAVAQRYRSGDFPMFRPPQKVIPPFPSLTEICYSRLLGCPPLPGMVDGYFDRDAQGYADSLSDRIFGERQPWERRLDYTASMFESAQSYLQPRDWYAAELARAKTAFDKSPTRVTIVYLTSASSMLCRFGRPGMDEVLDGIERFCVQLLYERQGAVKITLMADHGHNLMASQNIPLAQILTAAGFHVSDRLEKPEDVVLELHGLVTVTSIRTNRPAAVARALSSQPEITLSAYMDGARVMVRSADGLASIDCRDGKLAYIATEGDALGYLPLVAAMKSAGKADQNGFASDADWFAATLDHLYPDAPRRLWDAFHGAVIHPPDLIVTTKDGFCAGRDDFQMFIHMASTHGSLNQVNSATFVMSMTDRVKGPMRTGEMLEAIEPGWSPRVR